MSNEIPRRPKKQPPLTPPEMEARIKNIEQTFQNTILSKLNRKYHEYLQKQLADFEQARIGEYKTGKIAVDQKRWLSQMGYLINNLLHKEYFEEGDYLIGKDWRMEDQFKKDLQLLQGEIQSLESITLKKVKDFPDILKPTNPNIKKPLVPDNQVGLETIKRAVKNIEAYRTKMQDKKQEQSKIINKATKAYTKAKSTIFNKMMGKDADALESMVEKLAKDLRTVEQEAFSAKLPNEAVIKKMDEVIGQAREDLKKHTKQLFPQEKKEILDLIKGVEQQVASKTKSFRSSSG